MFRYTCFCGILEIKTPYYSAKKKNKNPFIYIRTNGIETILDLKIALALDGKEFELQDAGALSVNGHRTADVLELAFPGTLGQVLHLDFFEERIEAYVENVGRSRIVTLFSGSRFNCDIVFNPTAAFLPEHYFDIREAQSVAPSLFSPPPWFLAYRQFNGKWASSALEPLRGELDFRSLETAPGADHTMGWNINMGIPPQKDQPRRTPPLVFRFDDADEFAALQKHADHVAESGKVRRPVRQVKEWHKGILACGWRYQKKIPRSAECTQANYQAYVDMLDKNGIAFDTLIVDDFWGREYGIWREDKEKWPDMRAFIDKLHARGKHLLLWICITPTGLPPEERSGSTVNANSAAWKKRVEESMHYLLSDAPGCLNADGFKFDFTASLPVSYPPEARYRNMAFMYERFRIVTEAARAVKEDALLIYQCANPYFADVQNMLRLNDYFGLPETAVKEMMIRSRIAKIVSYDALIDTDHNSYNDFSYDFGEDYTLAMSRYGSPSLYLMEEDLKNEKLLKNLRQLKSSISK